MTITIEAKALRAAVAEVASVTPGGGETVPILANVLMEAEGPHLRLYGSDLDIALERQVDLAEPALPGSGLRTTVGAKLLAGIAAKLPAEAQVALELKGGRLLVSAGRARFQLAVLDPDEFPRFPDEEETVAFEIGRKQLADLIDAVSFAISTEETRYYLQGIYFHRCTAPDAAGTDIMWLRAAATDGHRLARYQLPLPDGAGTLGELGKGVIVPRKAIGLLRKLCDHEGDAPLQVAIGERRIRVEADATVLLSKLIDGTFPDYTRVIPEANDKGLSIDRATLREAIERVAVLSSDKTRAIKFALADDRLTLTVTSPLNGEAVEELPCDYSGQPLTIGFNAKYLLDILGSLGADEVAARLADPKAPVRVEPGGDAVDGRLFVIMPMAV